MKTVFTNTEINNEWSVNFLQNSLLDIQYTIEFSIGRSTANSTFDREEAVLYFFEFASLSSKIFQLRKEEKTEES